MEYIGTQSQYVLYMIYKIYIYFKFIELRQTRIYYIVEYRHLVKRRNITF